MKTWIGLAISDEKLAKTVQTLLKVNNAAQVVGIYSDARGAAADLKHKGDVLVIYGIGNDPEGALRGLKVIQLSGPFPIIGVGSVIDAAPILFDAFRLGMLGFVPFSPEEIDSPTDSLLIEMTDSIQAVGEGNVGRITRAKLKPFKETEKTELSEQAAYYVVLGIPRGGVNGAIKLLSQLPRRRDTALVASLPIPHVSVGPFIADLNPYTQWSIHPALEDEKISGGGCYLFSSFEPYTVEGTVDGKCRIITRPKNTKPIDSIMENLAGSFGGSVIGVLLEGIGSDGIDGLSKVKSRGGTTLTIKPGTGVLTGAPAGTYPEGAADLLVDGDDLPKVLTTLMAEMYDIANINRMLVQE